MPDRDEKIEKWIFRKAFEESLPETIVWRVKQEFSQGSGSAGLLPDYFERRIPDKEWEDAKSKFASGIIRKNNIHRKRLITKRIGESLLTSGRAVSQNSLVFML